MTDADIKYLKAAARQILAGVCPWCDHGHITHTRCTACINGQIDGATCAACHGEPITPHEPTLCPECHGSGKYRPPTQPLHS